MSKVILVRESDIFPSGPRTQKEPNTGLRKRDIKLIAEMLGHEYPPKKKEEKKEEKKEAKMGFLESVVLIAVGTYFAGLLQLLVLSEYINKH